MHPPLPLVPSRQGRGECLSLRAGGEAISGIWEKGILGRLLRHFVPRNDGKGGEIKKAPASLPGLLLAHRIEEAPVARGMLYLVEQELHGLYRVQGLEHLAEYPDPVELFLGKEQVFFPRAGLVEVDGREYPPLGELPVEDDFHVAGSLELLEYDLVHAAARVDKGRRHDGEAPALFDVPGGAEEPLGLVQRVRVHAAREHLSAGRHDGVIRPCEPRYRVEQYYHVLLVLDEPLCLLYDHLGDLHVPLRRLVEWRAYDLALNRPPHVGHLFGALVYEEHEEDYLWMVRGYRICEFLKEDGLAGPRRGDYEAPLPLADGREEVHYPHRDVCRLVLLLALLLEGYLLLRIEGGEVVEEYLVSGYLGVLVVDLLDFQESEVPLALLRGPYLAGDNVSRAQVEAPYLRGGYVYVVRARKVVVVRRAEKPEAVREGLEHAVAGV